MAECAHLDQVLTDVEPSSQGCYECEQSGGWWVHLRICMTCGHVGCCNASPGKHASAHHEEAGHPVVRSFEPGEDWWWCYPESLFFFVEGAPQAPSHGSRD
ncbi:MAG TPA: UBP-type zinc finger domain-containing protein [Acidimicrobiia bacterium]